MDNISFQFPTEMQLLLACCGLSMKQDDGRSQNQDRKESLERLSALSRRAKVHFGEEAIDWSRFMNLVDRHGMHLLVYHNINQYATEHILSHGSMARDVYLTLKDRSDEKKVKALTLTAELARLSKLFAEHDIFVLSLKGPALSQHLFGSLALRNPGDLDLLVKPEDLDQAEQLLLSNGYKLKSPDFALTARQKKAYLKQRHHVSYYHPQRLTVVELHWRLCANPHLLPLEYAQRMMTSTQQLSIAGTQITSLSDEDTLLYLCLHGAGHGWSHLKWLCDVSQFLHRKQAINWQAWAENVLALGLHRPVGQGLLLAQQLFDAPLPPATRLLTAEDQIIPQLVAHSTRLLMQSKQQLLDIGRLNAFRHMPYRMKLKADLRYRWSDFSKAWLSVDDWERYPLPDALFPLYSVLRPFSWLWQYSLSKLS